MCYEVLFVSLIYVLHAKLFIEKIKMHLQFISFLHTDMPQVVEILPQVRQKLMDLT